MPAIPALWKTIQSFKSRDNESKISKSKEKLGAYTDEIKRPQMPVLGVRTTIYHTTIYSLFPWQNINK